MELLVVEPDAPFDEDLSQYVYLELVKMAEAINQNFDEIDKELKNLDARITALGG